MRSMLAAFRLPSTRGPVPVPLAALSETHRPTRRARGLCPNAREPLCAVFTQVLGFSGEQSNQVWQLLAAILHIGDVRFNAVAEGETLSIENGASFETAAALLQVCVPLRLHHRPRRVSGCVSCAYQRCLHLLRGQVDPAQMKKWLCSRQVKSGNRGSTYAVHLSSSQAVDTRDALAKAIYSNLFFWIVSTLNRRMRHADGSQEDEDEENEEAAAIALVGARYIGLVRGTASSARNTLPGRRPDVSPPRLAARHLRLRKL